MSVSIVYGPVPSRRLGRSLGINNIPPKKCPYSCVYCQVGVTRDMQVSRAAFYEPADIYRQVVTKVSQAEKKDERIDYLAFVPDGEPTLDINLGKTIDLLKPIGIPIAVITNASLLPKPDVIDDLKKADWVCVKVDAITPRVWRRVNRPHGSLELSSILKGISDFAASYTGILVTETMLVRNINDTPAEARDIAAFLGTIKPSRSYISIPTRPPAEPVLPASDDSISITWQLFQENVDDVQYLIDYEGNEFSLTGGIKDDILSITAVHPMRHDAIAEFLKKADAGWDIIDDLLEKKLLVSLEFQGQKFYQRTFSGSGFFTGSSNG